MTTIQGIRSAYHHHNKIADSYKSRTQVNDDRLYEANTLPYKRSSVSLSTWVGRDSNQYVAFASDYGEENRWYEASVGENYAFGYLPPLDIEPVSSEELESIKTIVGKAATIAGSLVGDAFLNSVIEVAKSCMPPYARTMLYILMISYSVYKCAEKAYEEAISEYMKEHNCSREVAKENIVPTGLFLKKIAILLGKEGADVIVDRCSGLGINRKAGLQAVFSQVANVLDKNFSYKTLTAGTGGSFSF